MKFNEIKGRPVRPMSHRKRLHMLDGLPHIENERFWDIPDSSLRYIIKDATNAIEAMPDNPKIEKYSDEINDAVTVLHWRRKNTTITEEDDWENFTQHQGLGFAGTTAGLETKYKKRILALIHHTIPGNEDTPQAKEIRDDEILMLMDKIKDLRKLQAPLSNTELRMLGKIFKLEQKMNSPRALHIERIRKFAPNTLRNYMRDFKKSYKRLNIQ